MPLAGSRVGEASPMYTSHLDSYRSCVANTCCQWTPDSQAQSINGRPTHQSTYLICVFHSICTILGSKNNVMRFETHAESAGVRETFSYLENSDYLGT